MQKSGKPLPFEETFLGDEDLKIGLAKLKEKIPSKGPSKFRVINFQFISLLTLCTNNMMLTGEI